MDAGQDFAIEASQGFGAIPLPVPDHRLLAMLVGPDEDFVIPIDATLLASILPVRFGDVVIASR
ncbi:MAG: hypothetical protein KAV00_07000 [Phycisphaerae bacterium]|nr:hypothetical protein [Phycisphaerae bacterium]